MILCGAGNSVVMDIVTFPEHIQIGCSPASVAVEVGQDTVAAASNVVSDKCYILRFVDMDTCSGLLPILRRTRRGGIAESRIRVTKLDTLNDYILRCHKLRPVGEGVRVMKRQKPIACDVRTCIRTTRCFLTIDDR